MQADGVARYSAGEAGRRQRRVGMLCASPLLVAGVAGAVAGDRRLEWMGAVPDVRHAIELCVVSEVDALVVDLDAAIGTYGCRLLAGMFRETRVVVIMPAWPMAGREVRRVLGHGQADLVPREADVDRLLDLLATAVTAAAATSVTGLLDAAPTRHQLDVLRLCAEGLSNHEIADRLGLTEEAVRRNLRIALRKLHNHETAVLVARAFMPEEPIGAAVPTTRATDRPTRPPDD
ncbi:hypothetical protein UK23_14810 [Lentzea aerocolonigenes]|uniref:HTH luxR-type domain-containing protein n=1 Tax=Lentzea aerocolonigenes TaxID=68170 RepID=A0A0F0H2Y8_LENAE|nr:LuxR C-terminal-related transcriptional regulator [Lentzea aerocolonigenes]KJK49241.1 hypothetical protein UK23_14810 [Lentzea aerocolonigenes]